MDESEEAGPLGPVGAQREAVGVLFDLLAREAEGWAIFALDPAGCVTRWNVGAERLLGYTARDIEGTHFSILFTPKDVERGKPAEELSMAAERGRWEGESLAVRKERSAFWAKTACIALRDRAGALYGFARVVHALTRWKAAEAAVQLYLELWDNLPDGLLVFCPDERPGSRSFRILAANAALLKVIGSRGPSLEELAGARWSDVAQAFYPVLTEDVSNSLWSVIASGSSRNLGLIRRQEPGLAEAAFALRAFPLPRRCVGLLFEEISEATPVGDALVAGEAKGGASGYRILNGHRSEARRPKTLKTRREE